MFWDRSSVFSEGSETGGKWDSSPFHWYSRAHKKEREREREKRGTIRRPVGHVFPLQAPGSSWKLDGSLSSVSSFLRVVHGSDKLIAWVTRKESTKSDYFSVDCLGDKA